MPFLDPSRFFTVGLDTSQAIQASHQPILVVTSYLIAALAGLAFLTFARRVVELGQSVARHAWMTAGALTMGVGVWTMHFVAMLAYQLPIPFGYDPVVTALSAVPSILGSAVALYVVATPRLGRLLVGSIFMGAGIGVMHYTGMAAIQVQAHLRYEPLLFAASVLVAVGLSFAALFSTFWTLQRQRVSFGYLPQIIGALFIGFAVSAMHYTAMTSAFFLPAPDLGNPSKTFDPGTFAAITSAVTILVLVAAIAGVVFDRRLGLEVAAVKEAERRLARQELQYRQMFENAPVAMYRSHNRKIVQVNRAFEKLLGYRADEIIGRHRRDFMPVEDAEISPHVSDLTPSNDEAASAEHRLLRKDGRTVWANATFLRISNESSGDRDVLVHLQDITGRKAAEEQLRQVQKMESLGTLAGGIAHDFNNMLLPINALAELSTRQLPSDSPVQENLAAIIEASSKAAELVKQILAFSRQNEQQFAHVEISQFLTESLVLLRNVLPSTITIVDMISRDVGIIMGDRAQLLSVLINLGSNAAHAMDGKVGSLQVGVCQVIADQDLAMRRKSLLAGQPYAKIEVSDTGRGIPEGVLEKIFDPFFTTKPVGEGTGLGLSMVHGIVEQHRGDISVTSTVGSGATFEIYLPIEQVADGTVASVDAAATARRPARAPSKTHAGTADAPL